MKHLNNYNISNLHKSIAILLIMAITAASVFAIITSCSSEELATVWAMCKPGSQVNVRRTPSKKGQEVGYLDACDSFLTDGTSKNGFIRCYGIGEYGEGWIWCGYVATEEPRMIGGRYVCSSNARVACRKWMDGPRVDGKCWLTNGSTVQVFCIADGWAVTNRGYVQAQYLEADPE